MTPWLEFEGKNIDKALQIASENLSISKDDLKYDILSFGSSGIFGIVGVKKAKIRVYCSPLEDTKNGDILKTVASNADTVDSDRLNSIEASETRNTGASIEIIHDGIQQATDLLKAIVEAITENASIQVKRDEKRIIYTISGDHCDQLIGRRGQTLESIQYVMDRTFWE